MRLTCCLRTRSHARGAAAVRTAHARVGLNSAVEVLRRRRPPRLGRVAALDETTMIIEVLEATAGLTLEGTRVRIHGEPLLFGSAGHARPRVQRRRRPLDGGPPVAARARMRSRACAINPAWRALPRDFIETGVATIDVMNSLVRGQKLPLFSAGGLPHDRLAAEIAQRARLRGASSEDSFAIVFAGIGVPHDTAEQFRQPWSRAARSAARRCSSTSPTSRACSVC
jgi:V/A-type H+-transporting ATPase subunit B